MSITFPLTISRVAKRVVVPCLLHSWAKPPCARPLGRRRYPCDLSNAWMHGLLSTEITRAPFGGERQNPMISAAFAVNSGSVETHHECRRSRLIPFSLKTPAPDGHSHSPEWPVPAGKTFGWVLVQYGENTLFCFCPVLDRLSWSGEVAQLFDAVCEEPLSPSGDDCGFYSGTLRDYLTDSPETDRSPVHEALFRLPLSCPALKHLFLPLVHGNPDKCRHRFFLHRR
jgi:hypothetical protein